MKTFSIAGPTMWNELLTDELRGCTSVNVVQMRLIHIFIVNSYSIFLHNCQGLFCCYCRHTFIVIVCM